MALHYYEQRDYARAALFFLEAWRLEQRPEFLFNAARCEHKAMELGPARRHYEQVLGLPGLPAAVAARARQHLEELAAVEAAMARARAEGREAAERERASATERAGSEALAGMAGVVAARPLEGERPAEAAKPAETPKPVEGARPAQAGRPAEATRTAGAVKPSEATRPVPAARIALPSRPEPPSWQRPAGWASLGLGAALLVGGSVVFGLGYAEGERLDERYRGGKAIADKRSEVYADYDHVRAMEIGGASAAGLGLVLAGLGAWWLWGSEEAAFAAVRPVPMGHGLAQAWPEGPDGGGR